MNELEKLFLERSGLLKEISGNLEKVDSIDGELAAEIAAEIEKLCSLNLEMKILLLSEKVLAKITFPE